MRKWVFITAFMLIIILGSLRAPDPTAAPVNTRPRPSPIVAARLEPAATATAVLPTSTITPTPEPWTFPQGTLIAGEDVGGLTIEEAQQQVEQAIQPFLEPVQLSFDEQTFLLNPHELGLRVSITDLVTSAQEAVRSATARSRLHVPFQAHIDTDTLRSTISQLAPAIEMPAHVMLDRATNTFVLTPGIKVDIDMTAERVASRLRSPDYSRRVTIVTRSDEEAPPPTEKQILEALDEYIQEFDGVIGVYAAMVDGRQLLSYNANTIFSGVSVMKVAILLQSYMSLENFTDRQKHWIEQMMIYSDNKSANHLLTAIATAEKRRKSPLFGARVMNKTLEELGLKHSMMIAPYESVGKLVQASDLEVPEDFGEPPYTDPDPYIRATPAEMGKLMMFIGQCAEGNGPLLELVSQLTARRCKEMLALMVRNADRTKIVAGLPTETVVAHKSGWIGDTRADVGLINANNEMLVLSIWIWSNRYKDGNAVYIPTKLADSLIANIARTLYSAYHPYTSTGILGKSP